MDNTYSMKLKDLAEQLDFTPVYLPKYYDDVYITTANLNRPGLELAGFYDYFDENRIQLMGKNETAFLEQFSLEERKFKIEKLMSRGIPAIVICHDCEPMPECIEAAKKYDVALYKTEIDTSELLATMIAVLQDCLAPRITRHGVLVEIYGEGVLITGESGVGKSEAAVELIKRGHRLIADDAVEIKRINSTTLMGTAPDLIRYYIEMRGIGIIDVRRIFGSGAVKLNEKIDLVINVETWKDGLSYDRMGMEDEYTSILDVEIPFIKIPIKPGRNLAVILEVAAMNNKQKKMGYNSAKELDELIMKHFESQMKGQGKND